MDAKVEGLSMHVVYCSMFHAFAIGNGHDVGFSINNASKGSMSLGQC
jgi:hypothetical protein